MMLATQMTPARANTAVQKHSKDLYALLGKLPPRDRKVSAQIVATEDRGAYTLEKLVLDLNGIEPAPAWFAKPASCLRRRA